MTWSAGRRFRLTFVLAAGAALGVAAVACGGRTVDPTEMAATISAKITEQQPGIGTVTVTCPKGIDPVKGASFQCSYTGTSGTGGAVDVTMTDDAGTLSIRYPAPAGTVPISGGGFHAFDPGPDATAAPTDTTDPNASPGGDSSGFGTGSGSGGSGGGGSGSGQIGSSGGQVGSSGGFAGSGSGSGSGSDSGSGSSGQAPPAADNPDPVGHLGP